MDEDYEEELQNAIDCCPGDSVIVEDPNGELCYVDWAESQEPHFDKRTIVYDPVKIRTLQDPTDDKEIERLIWEEWEGHIKEEDPREMVFKYMKLMREKLIQKIETEEIPIEISRFFNDKGEHITKKEYGKILIEELCKILRNGENSTASS